MPPIVPPRGVDGDDAGDILRNGDTPSVETNIPMDSPSGIHADYRGTNFADDPRFNSLATDPQRGIINPKGEREALAILNAEAEGILESPRRPNPSLGESVHADDYYATVNGTPNVSVEIKTPFENPYRTIAQQARDIIGQIGPRPLEQGVIIIDLGYLTPEQTQVFLREFGEIRSDVILVNN